MRLIRVDTGYRHALGDRYHLLILCLRYGANWYDWQPLQASALRIDIKGFQCFDRMVLPKVISGAPLDLL